MRLEVEGIDDAQLTFRGEDFPFFHLTDDAWYGLVVLDMTVSPRTYRLTVLAEREAGDVTFEREIRIESAGYIVQEFDLPAGRANLADADIETEEFAAIAAITAEYTPEPLWDADRIRATPGGRPDLALRSISCLEWRKTDAPYRLGSECADWQADPSAGGGCGRLNWAAQYPRKPRHDRPWLRHLLPATRISRRCKWKREGK